MDRLRRSINPHALEIFRIALGALLFVDLSMRYQNLEAHYTNAGAFPMPLGFLKSVIQAGRIDPFLLSDSIVLHHLLFGIGLVAAACFCLGVATRPAQLIVWLVLLGTHNRNPLVNAGADIYIRGVLFWSLFLPLGQQLVLPTWRSRSSSTTRTPLNLPSRVEALGLCAYSAQLAVVYLCSCIAKWNTPYWPSGNGLELALRVDIVRGPLADTLLSVRELLTLLSYLTLAVQLAAATLLFIPPHLLRRTRMGVLGGLVGMHLGIIGALSVGLVPYYAIVSLIPLVPRFRVPISGDANADADATPDTDPAVLNGTQAGVPAGLSLLDWTKLAGMTLAALYVVLHLLVYYGQLPSPPTPVAGASDRFGRASGLKQHWIMFSGIEYNPYGRVVGYRASGPPETLFEIAKAPGTSEPWDTDPTPPRYEFADAYASYRWKKLFASVLRRDDAALFADVTRFLCRDAERRSGPDHFLMLRYTYWHEKRSWQSGETELETYRDNPHPCL